MKKDRNKYSTSSINDRRRSLSSDKDVFIKHRRKRRTNVRNNTIPVKRSSCQFEILDEFEDIFEDVCSRSSKKTSLSRSLSKISTETFVSIDLTEETEDELPVIGSRSPSPSQVLDKPKRKNSISNSARCKYCGDLKDSVIKCSAPLAGAYEEKEVLNFREIRNSWKIDGDIPCTKLLDFRVYDKARHLCSFDEKLIDAQDGLFFSGYIKPFDSATNDYSDTFPSEDMGPITDWWFEGFDLNEESSVGFSSKLAHYYLTEAMPEYAPFMASVKEKIFLAKIVVDILEDVPDDENLSYESFLNILLSKIPPEGIPALTEEILLKNGIFVCKQIQSYDSDSGEGKQSLASEPCIQELSQKVGYDFNAASDEDSDDASSSGISIDGDTEARENVIDFIDLDEFDSDIDSDDEAVKRGRRRRRRKVYVDEYFPDDDDDDAEERRIRKRRENRKRFKGPVRPKGPLRPKVRMSSGMIPTKPLKLSHAATTPLVKKIFVGLFKAQCTKDYSRDTDSDLKTSRCYDSVESYHDYNLMIPNLCLTRIEDMSKDVQNYEVLSSSETCLEERKVEECEHSYEKEKDEEKDKPEPVLEKEESESTIVQKEDENKTELLHEKEENESQLLHENEPDIVHEEKTEINELRVSVPSIREFVMIKVERLSEDIVKFYLNKKKTEKRKIISLDSFDEESEIECAPKRTKMEEKLDDDTPSHSVLELKQFLKKKKGRRSSSNKIRWIEKPIKEAEGYEYYKSVQINDSTVSVGDFITVYESNSIGRIMYMFEDIEEEMLFHVHWFTRSIDTILAEVGHPNELFESKQCQDIVMRDFYQVVSVKFIPTGSDWFNVGNSHYVNLLNRNEDPSSILYYQKRYCDKTARFEDVESESSFSMVDCSNCEKQRKVVQQEIPYSEEKSRFDKEKNMYSLKMVRWRNEEYHIGTCVFLIPGSIMKIKSKKKDDDFDDEDEDYDEDLYPEKYRKPARFRSVQDEDVVSEPFDIGYISGIWSKKRVITKSADVQLEVKKFYRPHNTSLSQSVVRKVDLNLLYWSDEDCTVDFSKVQGKCYVAYEENVKCPLDEWSKKGPYRFYFSQTFNRKYKMFETPPEFARKIGNLEKDDERDHVDIPAEYPSICRPLRSLDVFAGCGGLTEGLHQANVADCHWAVEKDPAAAKAFQLNYPNATVFTDDCNLLLNAIMRDQHKMWRGKMLPQRGEVEMICGGPPCQGFSGMNRFSYGEWSQFNNSLILTYLSYCDYFRPRFVVMENVRNFVSHKKSLVLKLTLSCLVKMGYQVAFGVLQSGRFGIPQSRRRVIILAAAPGEILPEHPELTHTFGISGAFETVNVDEIKYITNARWTSSGPYRMITVYDAISDLPPIKAGDRQVERPYGRKALTHFQRDSRTYNGVEENVLRDHISKNLNPLVVKRLSFIPKKLGCDWRDLPNIVIKLSDGTYTNKLQYTHHDAKQGKARNGALRGVCSCANNGDCKPEFRQSNTLIPWCLPHTSNRHGHWRGLYGRLGWDEYFRTVITNPEPMGKQGRVVHPEDDRVISVKECARSQGFPDKFKFYGLTLDKHRQIGNAVAPPLAKAIGLEIKKCIHAVESKTRTIAD